jgi:hypothetical protein
MKTEKIVKDSAGNVVSSSTQMSTFRISQPIGVDVDPNPVDIAYKDALLTVKLGRIKTR